MGVGKGRSARRGTVVSVVVLAAILALILAGCGRAASSLATPPVVTSPVVTSVHVLRTSAFPSNHIPPFDRTVSDATKAQRLYDAVQALPPFPKETFSCPVDWGEAYHLTFYRDRAEFSWAIVKPDGCREVTLPNNDIRWSVNQDQFWQVFADVLGVSQSNLYPTSRPDGPSAPTPVLSQP